MNVEQILGPLRVALPFLSALLVGWGMDDASAGAIAGGAIMIIAGVWSFMTNRQVAVAKQAIGPGVEVLVGPTAPPAMKAAAADPAVVGIVPKRNV